MIDEDVYKTFVNPEGKEHSLSSLLRLDQSDDVTPDSEEEKSIKDIIPQVCMVPIFFCKY